jgi:hypothetical protein
MVLASSTSLIKYMKIRWVGFNTDQSHSVGNSFTHSSVLYRVRRDEMCRIGLSFERSKILEKRMR